MRSGLALGLAGWAALLAGSAAARDISVSMAQIPNLSDSADAGVFVDLVKAIDDVYLDGALSRRVFPFARSVDNVVKGVFDCQIPMLRNPGVDESHLPYRFVSERLGIVAVVLYSHTSRPLTRDQIQESLRKGGPFPYQVETLRGATEFGDFPKSYADSVRQGLQRVAAGRTDAFFMVQDEADFVLRELKLREIHRSLYLSFDDVMVIPRGPRGEELDRILSEAIRALKASGRWDALYHKIHRPYEDWQPAAQAW